MTDTPEVTVVIPLYNDADTIGAVLAALLSQEGAPETEIIVVDDGSTDAGPDLVGPPARLVVQENGGPAKARNTGAREARGNWVLFLDADCLPPPNWIATMLARARDLNCNAVMGTLSAATDGIVPRIVQMEVEDRYRSMAAAKTVDFIAAPACGVRRDVFLQIGGFDERLRQAEDVEIAYRLVANGHPIAFAHQAPVAHAHQETWGEFLRAKYVRALGRLRVFDLFPEKKRHDSWTPLSLKVQFASVTLALPALVIGLFWTPFLLLAMLLLILAVALGWPFVRATTERLKDLAGPLRGFGIGAGFVIVRSLVILLAMIRHRIDRLTGSTITARDP